ncbi:hypothetical protein ACPPVO_35750 [Dactylosporangium sp. McL0621]|uniref:hypothetical protein n=1 Tax=Dactylosporangium sp. McL0621 TaxID=3415678 RepID=UPI003CEC6EC3
MSDAHDEEFDVSDVHTGGGNDLGLDGIAILVNGVLVNSTEEVEDLLQVNGYLEVSFVFVQAKSGGNFSGEHIAALLDGVDEFFEESPTLPMNEKVTNSRQIMSRAIACSTGSGLSLGYSG